jgi:MFS family permease
MHGLASLMRRRNFALYFAGRCVSFLGNAMAPVALAFAVLDLTDSATALGVVLAARIIPQVLLLLVGGVIADRLPRSVVLIGSNAVGGISQAGVAALLITGHAELWHLIVLEAINGGASAMFYPADSALVPLTAPPEQLQEANAIVRVGSNVCMILGAALAGLLVALINPGWTVAVDAATFLVAAMLIAGMRGIKAAAQTSNSFVRDLVEGWGEFIAHRWLWTIVVQFSLMLIGFFGAFMVLGPVVADRELSGPSSWAAIVGAQSAGLLVGGLLVVRWRASRPLLVATLGVFTAAGPMACLALGLPAPVVAAMAFANGLAMEVFAVYWYTALQEQVAPEALARVSSYDALGSIGLSPIGLLAAGPLADSIGIDATLWIGVGLVVVPTALVLLVPEVRNLRSSPRRSGAASLPGGAGIGVEA